MANKIKWNEVQIIYCILHGRDVLAEHQNISENGIFSHYSGIGELPCHGPFAYCSPPPPLTEEEWEVILEKEYYRYAN